ncbi:hypothetical protein OSB04_020690 [Centaurea solstitialis]|uniref:Uncharacterized protein n=1 Tax=Centaurea solstitialis TaxID=347529 RepID=A0AA38W637_9ASTR|nr:hypothetical protein OSB04_020690 [Centaurea solstitialis]
MKTATLLFGVEVRSAYIPPLRSHLLVGYIIYAFGLVWFGLIYVYAHTHVLQELSLKGFWLPNWFTADKTHECREMIDYLLGLVREGKLKYDMELVPLSEFHTALDKALGKHGSQPKQVIKF